MRAVVDANVFVSAAGWAGAPNRIVQRWLEYGDFDIVASPKLLGEVRDVLTRRPRMRERIDLDAANRFVANLNTMLDLVSDPDPLTVRQWTRDADDDYLVAMAREHGADVIVSGDKDLLDWDEQVPPVVTPADFETMLGPPST